MTPTETALVLLLSLASGTGGWAIGQGKVKTVEVPYSVPYVVNAPSPKDQAAADAAMRDLQRQLRRALSVRHSTPACGQHARFDPVELEYHKHRLADGTFSRVGAE